MIVTVTGGRDFNNLGVVWCTLDWFHTHGGVTLLRNGRARGADYLAWQWAKTMRVPEEPFKADWTQGKSAGHRRNAVMLAAKPVTDVLVAFPGGKGTNGCVEIAERMGIIVIRVEAE